MQPDKNYIIYMQFTQKDTIPRMVLEYIVLYRLTIIINYSAHGRCEVAEG